MGGGGGGIIGDILNIAAVIPSPIQPFAAAGAAIYGAVQQTNAQNSQSAAYNTATGNQGAALGQVTSLAEQEATGPSFQSLLDAQKGGIKTLKSEIGGLPNEGALVKDLYGQNIENAIGASIQQRNNNLNGAISALLGTSGQYGGIAANAAAGASGAANPWTGVGQSIWTVLNQIGKKPGGAPGTSGTGPGDIFVPTFPTTPPNNSGPGFPTTPSYQPPMLPVGG